MRAFKLVEVTTTDLSKECALELACTKAKEYLNPLHPNVTTIKLELASMNMDYNYQTKVKTYNYSFRIIGCN